MRKYYKGKSYSPVTRTQAIGAQPAERESLRKTRQTQSSGRREQ